MALLRNMTCTAHFEVCFTFEEDNRLAGLQDCEGGK